MAVYGGSFLRTDNSLRVFGTRGAEAEFPQLCFSLVGEGVEARFGRLNDCGTWISQSGVKISLDLPY
jgi:hypothetical protein